MATGYEVRMYQDISNIEQHLRSIAESLDKIAASQRLIATAAMHEARYEEVADVFERAEPTGNDITEQVRARREGVRDE